MKPIECVLLPGLDGTGTFFAPFAAALSAWAGVTVISYPNDRLLDYDDLAEFVLGRLPRSGSYCLIAESFSGPAAIKVAHRRPPGLVALVLAASFAAAPYPRFAWLLATILAGIGRSPVPAAAVSAFLLNGADRNLAREVADTIRLIDRDVLTGRAKLALSCDVLAELAAVAIPVLAVRANQDRIVPGSATRRMAEVLPHLVVERIDAPHFVLQVEASTVAERLVRPFLAGNDVANM